MLGILWLVFGGLSLLAGLAALHFAHDLFSGGFAPWEQYNHMFPDWFFPAAIHFSLAMMILRAVVCAIAGMGFARTHAVGTHHGHHRRGHLHAQNSRSGPHSALPRW